MARNWSHKKRKSTPKTLLKLGTTTDDIANKTEQNTQDCPLLSKLSPELRNRVYAFAFGDRDVHIRIDPRKTGKLEHHICLVAHQPSVDAEQYVQHHDSCFTEESRLPLALLQTCRQIHNEAALVPYATVNYIIDVEAFTTFMRKLIREQKKALDQLSMFASDRPFEGHLILLGEIKDLTNVKRLSIISIRNDSYRRPYAGLEKFARLPLENISFTLSPLPQGLLNWWSGTTIERLRIASSVLEAKLLRPWAETERIIMEEAAERQARRETFAPVDRGPIVNRYQLRSRDVD